MNTTTPELEFLINLLPFLIPLIVLQFVLMAVALIHIWAKSTKELSTKIIWTVIILCINTLGPIAYLTFGRNMGGEADEKHDDLHKY